MCLIHLGKCENCQAAMGTGFQLPQRVNKNHRAGSPQICGVFTTTITPIVGLV